MDDEPVAGIFPMIGPDFDGVPENWLAYLAVDDVDAVLKAAKGAGAKVALRRSDGGTCRDHSSAGWRDDRVDHAGRRSVIEIRRQRASF